MLAARVVTFAPDRLGWTSRTRTRTFLTQIEERYPGELAQGVDVVHVLGRRWWSFGASVAREMDAGLVLEIWRSASIERAAAMSGKHPTALLASDPAIHKNMIKAGLGELSKPASWGVHALHAPNAILPSDRPASVMVMGPRGDLGAVERALRGLAEASKEHELLVFVDASLAPKTHIWRCARDVGLLECLSIIEDMEGERELVLAGDLLVLPSPDGENRSIVLDAMGHGMLVVSPKEPAIEPLSDPAIATLLRDSSEESWANAFRGAFADSEASRNLGKAAWEFVRERRKGSQHVVAIIDAYEWLTSNEPLPFNP